MESFRNQLENKLQTPGKEDDTIKEEINIIYKVDTYCICFLLFLNSEKAVNKYKMQLQTFAHSAYCYWL